MQKNFIQSLFGSVIKPILFFLVNLGDQGDYPAFLPLGYCNFVTCVQKSAGRQMSVVNQRIDRRSGLVHVNYLYKDSLRAYKVYLQT